MALKAVKMKETANKLVNNKHNNCLRNFKNVKNFYHFDIKISLLDRIWFEGKDFLPKLFIWHFSRETGGVKKKLIKFDYKKEKYKVSMADKNLANYWRGLKSV